jgi:hypothetical protein
MKLWIAASAGMHAWRHIVYFGGCMRMMKHCLRIPNMFNDIACTGMLKIEKFFFVNQSSLG